MTEGLLTKVTAGLKQFVASNPSVLTAKSLINQKGGCIASKTQQSDSLWLAVNPPPFNKGGKCGGAKQGIVRVWEVMRGEGVCDNNIKKRSQHITVTAAYSNYCFA